jgi:hypothetical protein
MKFFNHGCTQMDTDEGWEDRRQRTEDGRQKPEGKC